MATKQEIQNIKTNIEKTIQGLQTNLKEFRYENGGFVKPNTLYSIYYTLTKQEIYLTGIQNSSNSRIIRKDKPDTLFSQYSNIKTFVRQDYPKTTPANPSESDYRIGRITRYFTKKTNEVNGKVFEITEKDFGNQNNLYDYTAFEWRISGKKLEVNRDNSATLREIQSEFPNITKTVFPLQLWIPPKNSPDDVQKKLSLLKKT